MASPKRLARSAEAFAPSTEAQDARLRAFIVELDSQLNKRIKLFAEEGSDYSKALIDVWFSVRHAAAKIGVDL